MSVKKMTIEEVKKFIASNKYKVGADWNRARCVDGRYDNSEDLPPLAKPGADVGDLLMLFAANREYALQIPTHEIFHAVTSMIDGEENFQLHSDEHAVKSEQPSTFQEFLGCGHFKLAATDPESYALDDDDTTEIGRFLEDGAEEHQCTVLEGEHEEQAVLIVKGDKWSVAPKLQEGGVSEEVFVYHKSLDDRRRRLLAEKLVEKVHSDFGTDEEHLYEVLSIISDDQLDYTISQLAPELPTFQVTFSPDGQFEIDQL